MDTSVGPGRPCLDRGPWSVRLGRSVGGRAALEVYEDGALVDVVVASPVAPQVLGGALRGSRAGRPSAIAWGRLPADPPDLAVSSTGRLRRPAAAEAIKVGRDFWVAVACGRFGGVRVAVRGVARARLRTRKGRSW